MKRKLLNKSLPKMMNLNDIEKKLVQMGFTDIEYYVSNKNLILNCERLTDVPDEHLDAYCEKLKYKLENINEAQIVNAYITRGDIKPFLFEDLMTGVTMNTFVANYQRKYLDRKNICLLKEDVYSLLLIYAISGYNTDILKNILNMPHYANIFTSVCKIFNSSPLHDLLITDSQELQIEVSDYLRSTTNSIPKTNIHDEEKRMYHLFNFPLISDMSHESFIDEIMRPLLLEPYVA